MIARGRAALLAAAVAASAAGCARPLVVSEKAHGSLDAVTARAPTQRAVGAPLVVLVQRASIRAFDPRDAAPRWRWALRVTGHPVADAEVVYVPIEGHRLTAIERTTGRRRFTVELPGEALTGVAAAGGIVVVSHLGGRDRSGIVGLDPRDGRLLWARRSAARLGEPAIMGGAVVVPIAGQVAVLDADNGRQRARLDLPPGGLAFERVVAHHRGVWAMGGPSYVDLRAPSKGKPASVERGFAPLRRAREGFDPGHDDAERIAWRVAWRADGAAPRSAVFAARRAIIGVRLAPDGRVVLARWAKHLPPQRELVAVDVAGPRVTVVLDDGEVRQLSTRTGRTLVRILGEDRTRGALVLDVAAQGKVLRRRRKAQPDVRQQLVEILEDRDPRTLPAQRFAAQLLWRDEAPEGRASIEALAGGEIRDDATVAGDALRAYARDLTQAAWGPDDPGAVADLRAELLVEPTFLGQQHPSLQTLAARAVRTGSPALVPALVEHLLHPATRPADLAAVAEALATLRRDEAVAGVAEFVRRYHADPDVIYESQAMEHAIAFLADRAKHGESDAAAAAAQTLGASWSDPFTDPRLRGYIARAGWHAPAALANGPRGSDDGSP